MFVLAAQYSFLANFHLSAVVMDRFDCEFPPPPEYLRQLHDEHHPHSQHFLHAKYSQIQLRLSDELVSWICISKLLVAMHTRLTIAILPYFRFGCTEVAVPGWNPSFHVQGQVCHCIGSLMPLPNETSQVPLSLLLRQPHSGNSHNGHCKWVEATIVHELSLMLNQENQYVQNLQTVHGSTS